MWANSYCSGALTAPDVVATASHCLGEGPLPHVVIGEEDLCTAPVYGERIGVADIVTGSGPASDLALLVLERDAAAEPVALASITPIDEVVTAVGWGRASLDRARPCQAKRVKLELSRGARCDRAKAAADGGGPGLQDWLCLEPVGAQNTCIGDSGGGVYHASGDQMALLGITLGGTGCGAEDVGVYASAAAIAALMNGSIDRAPPLPLPSTW